MILHLHVDRQTGIFIVEGKTSFFDQPRLTYRERGSGVYRSLPKFTEAYREQPEVYREKAEVYREKPEVYHEKPEVYREIPVSFRFLKANFRFLTVSFSKLR